MYAVRISLMVFFVAMVYMKIAPAASDDGMKMWDPSSEKSRDLAEQLLELLQKKLPADPQRHIDKVFEAGYNEEKKQYFVSMKVCMPRPTETQSKGCDEDACEASKEESGCNDEQQCKSKEEESGCDEGCFENAEDDNTGCSDSSSCVFGSSKGLGGLSAALSNMERFKRQSGDNCYCEKCSICACCSNCSGDNQLKIKNHKCEPCSN